MGKIKDWVLGVLVKKYALGPVVAGYKKLEGYKTVLAMIGMGLVFGAQVFGFIPAPLADELYKVLGAIGGVAFLEKLKRYQPVAEKLANEVKKEAEKEEAKAEPKA